MTSSIGSWSLEIPASGTTLWLGPLLALWVWTIGAACGHLKVRRRWRTGDTRKLFHFTFLTTLIVVSAAFGHAGVNLLGGIGAVYIARVLWLADGHAPYEALARESDAPNRRLFIAIPCLATAAGGLVSASAFGPFALIGFAVVGWGDAVGEPVGIRFGRHPYRVPTFGLGAPVTRSIEGSAAVFAASLVAAFLVLGLSPFELDLETRLIRALIVAVVAVSVEAISHHGLDNFTLQVAASATAWWLGGAHAGIG